MKLLASILSLTLAIAGVQTSPVQSRQALDRFQIQTQVLSGNNDCGSNKGGQYIFSYHTGAGLGIAAGGPEPTGAGSYYYLNDTTLLWTYEGSIGPWKTSILYGAYQAYNPISISIASDDATPGFYFDGNILKTNASEGGWLMCDSWYQSPQLFAIEYTNGPYPSSCSFVQLVGVPAA